jgi:hypothetical protein
MPTKVLAIHANAPVLLACATNRAPSPAGRLPADRGMCAVAAEGADLRTVTECRLDVARGDP